MQGLILFVVSLVVLFSLTSANVLSLNVAKNDTDIPSCTFSAPGYDGGNYSIFNDQSDTCNFLLTGLFRLSYKYNANNQLCFFATYDSVCRTPVSCVDAGTCRVVSIPELSPSSDDAIRIAVQWRQTGRNNEISSSNVVSVVAGSQGSSPACLFSGSGTNSSTVGNFSIFSDVGTCNYLFAGISGFYGFYYTYNSANELCISSDPLCPTNIGNCVKAGSCATINIQNGDDPRDIIPLAIEWQQTSRNTKPNILSFHINDDLSIPTCDFAVSDSIPLNETSPTGNYSIFNNPNTCNVLLTGDAAILYSYQNNLLCISPSHETCTVITANCVPANTCRIVNVNNGNNDTAPVAIQWQGAVGSSSSGSSSSGSSSSGSSSSSTIAISLLVLVMMLF